MKYQSYIFLIFALLFCGNNFFAQKSSYTIGLESRFKSGFLLPHRSVMHHLLQGHSIGSEISVIGLTNGEKEWHQTFNYPKIGGKLYISDFGNPEQLGWAIGTAIFGEFPYFRNSWMTLNTKLTGGLSYINRKFDQQENPKNNSVSTHLNSLIIFGTNVNFLFGKNEFALGLDMTHLSNGATKLPNLGVNVPYLSFAYTRYFETPSFETEEREINPFLKSLEDWHISLLGTGSTKQIYPTGGRNYPVFSLSAFLSKKISRKAGLDFAVDLFYNESIKDTDNGNIDANFADIIQIGTYAGYFLPINRLRIMLGMGYYLKNDFNPDGPLYHRLSVRYKLNQKLDFHFGIKSHWGRADYFEYGLMYRVFK